MIISSRIPFYGIHRWNDSKFSMMPMKPPERILENIPKGKSTRSAYYCGEGTGEDSIGRWIRDTSAQVENIVGLYASSIPQRALFHYFVLASYDPSQIPLMSRFHLRPVPNISWSSYSHCKPFVHSAASPVLLTAFPKPRSLSKNFLLKPDQNIHRHLPTNSPSRNTYMSCAFTFTLGIEL